MPIDHTIFTDQHRLGAAERALTSIQWVPALNCEGLVWQPPLGQPPLGQPPSLNETDPFDRGVASEKRRNALECEALRSEIAKRDEQIKALQESELLRKNAALLNEIGAKAARVKALEEQVANLKHQLSVA